MSISNNEKTCAPYRLEFAKSAKKEWDKLDSVIQKQFATKLKERLKHPKIPADRLKGMLGCYKIKLRASGYRLVYEAKDEVLIVLVLAVGKRERNKVYATATKRFNS